MAIAPAGIDLAGKKLVLRAEQQKANIIFSSFFFSVLDFRLSQKKKDNEIENEEELCGRRQEMDGLTEEEEEE